MKERLAKTIGAKRIFDFFEKEQNDSPVKITNPDFKFQSRHVVPHLIHPDILFVMGGFVGADKYLVMEKTDTKGVVFKRLKLLDDSIAHDWIITSRKQLFKIDGPTVRPSFISLLAKNFPDRCFQKDKKDSNDVPF